MSNSKFKMKKCRTQILKRKKCQTQNLKRKKCQTQTQTQNFVSTFLHSTFFIDSTHVEC